MTILMGGISAAASAAASYSLTGTTITNGISGVAGVRIGSDGIVESIAFIENQIFPDTDWVIPNGVASADYDVRYTNLTGDPLTSAPAAEDVWVDLSVDRTFSVGVIFPNTANTTLTIEIRDPLGVTVASGTYTLIASVAGP